MIGMFGIKPFQPNYSMPVMILDLRREQESRAERRARKVTFGRKERKSTNLPNKSKRFYRGGHNKDRYHR